MKTLHKPTERVLVILETLANVDGMTLSELSLKTDISKGTIFPILKSLQYRKYISYDTHSGIYTLGISCAVLASSAVEKEFWIKMINSEMHAVVNECNEVCQLGILDDAWVLYVDKVQGDQTVQLVSKIGTRLPAICSALGKSLLHKHSDEDILELYPQGFPSVTARSVTNMVQLRQQLTLVATNGYSMDDREINDDTICLAVPLQQKETILAAISVSLPSFRATDEKIQQVIGSLKDAKQRIESVLNKLPDIQNY
ncbi:IclR family transcriptional regulator [Klebsiella sp. BIGb0407]|uniref:IclR family transcriptional regulator n=1 Tax=Klebsiella sp. BIGb0407 TaxID=2940603 RepID=UPI00216A7F58|nr:IclR family transcriptional regulator [Klebsiella sp. BIGb0407]MCS3433772.1 DNA-binding IclR family transcriptional regulator [Klebsiella sp. BIGb0407]